MQHAVSMQRCPTREMSKCLERLAFGMLWMQIWMVRWKQISSEAVPSTSTLTRVVAVLSNLLIDL